MNKVLRAVGIMGVLCVTAKTLLKISFTIGSGYGIGLVTDCPPKHESDYEDSIEYMEKHGCDLDTILLWFGFIGARKNKKKWRNKE